MKYPTRALIFASVYGICRKVDVEHITQCHPIVTYIEWWSDTSFKAFSLMVNIDAGRGQVI